MKSAPLCGPETLHVVMQKVSEATQQESRLFKLVNTGRRACDLDGYPSVSLRTAADTPVAFIVRHSGDQMVTGARPRPVELLPGHAAWSLINQVVCVGRQISAPARLAQFRPPGTNQALRVALSRYPVIAECRQGDPGRVLHVSPIEPTPADASNV